MKQLMYYLILMFTGVVIFHISEYTVEEYLINHPKEYYQEQIEEYCYEIQISKDRITYRVELDEITIKDFKSLSEAYIELRKMDDSTKLETR